MTVTDIIGAIKTSGFSNDDLNRIAESVRFARAELGRNRRDELSIGSTVQFKNGGQIYFGTVEGIKIKNALVNTARGRYRVPMNMLTVATPVSE